MTITGMSFYKMTTLFFTVILCSLHLVYSEFVWDIAPRESIALAGDNVTITCTFSTNNSSDPEERFWWLRPDHNFRFVRNEAVLLGSLQRERYIVHLNKNAGYYTLTIANVQHLDGGQFQCSHRQGRNDVTVTSQMATLIVLSPPPNGYPRCEYYSKSNLILSPSLTRALLCPNIVSWKYLNQIMTGNTFQGLYHHWENLEGFFLQNGTTILSQSSQTETDASISFCMTEQTMLRLFPTECSLVQDVDINMISLFIQPAGVHVRVGENMTFTCTVRGALKASKYEWAFPSNLQSTSLQISHQGRTATLTKLKEPPKKSGNEFTIVCQVTLENGCQRTALTNVTIIKREDGHIIDRKGNSPNIIKTLRELNKPKVIKNPVNDEVQPRKPKGNSTIIMDFLLDSDKMAIVLGPSLAVIVFFVCLSFVVRCRRRKKTIAQAPPQIIVPLMETKPDKRVKKFTNTHLDIPTFSRSYSDATSYRYSRNFDIHNTFQATDDSLVSNGKNVQQQAGSRRQQSINGCRSMPSLDFKSNSLPSKIKRNHEMPLPPNSFMDLPHQYGSSASHLEPRAMEWRHKRSVHFASAPPKPMKKRVVRKGLV